MKTPIKYEPHRCESCGQTTTYVSKLNRGLARLHRTVANAVLLKGENLIRVSDLVVDHRTPEWADPNHRMRQGRITHVEHGNISHLSRHGLLVGKDTGMFLIPKKGWAFQRGEEVELAAVVDKKTHRNVGYVADAEGCVLMTNIREIHQAHDGWWTGWDYDIGPDGSLVRVPRSQ